MKDDAKIFIVWNVRTSMYQARVDYKGQTSSFPLPDAHNELQAINQARKDYASV